MRAPRPFVHLHCHSHYSLLDGASRLPELTRRVKALGMEAVALTDHGNLYGAVEFLQEAKAAGVKPILGIEAYVAPTGRADRVKGGVGGKKNYFHLTLLARTGEGFRNLIRLSSKAFLEGFYSRPRIDKEILERHSEGLICLSGCVASEFSDFLLNDREAEADALVDWYRRVFGPEGFFIEVQENGYAPQREHRERAVDLARRKGVPVVGTSDAHYLTREDAQAHDVLLCVSSGKTIDDPSRLKFDTDQYYVRSPDEMYAAMPGHDEALAMSARIAESVEENYESFGLGRRCFPSFTPPGEEAPEDYLRRLCEEGLRELYGDPPPPEAADRLAHELEIIVRMGFASYFLIVWDFVRYAREQGIPASARGSACGALVSYVLRLSSVDPLAYDLLFERFLDPNRNEAPDIDIDLCKDRRYEVIDYVRRKYGEDNVAQIGTFGTMAAKAAIKDVGRALNVPLARVDVVTKLVPGRLGITLEEAIDEEAGLRKLRDEDPDLGRLLEYARRLEGTVRNVSTHAAGVVIASRPLIELCPLQRLPNKDKDKDKDKESSLSPVSTQWEMGDVEAAGLLKVDFLGLRNLTSLVAMVKMIKRRHPGAPVDDLDQLPLDDPKTFELLQRGETKGVFQLESAGIRDLLIKMRPDRFADIIATNALYRPGPLNGGMVDEYVNVKHGRKSASYAHPVMREVLEETYGVMVYQEQVMRILNRLGGIELSTAYATIKAISKKKAETIAKGRTQFIAGAAERGLDKGTATKIFDLIEFFGGYGFNKSHSTAYALLAYQTAYLKAHYPTEFMACVLSSEMDGSERDKFFYEHIEDCRRMEIELLKPDVNAGGVDFEPADEPGKMLFGLGAIKGVGYRAIESLVRARREGGPFAGLDDFCERVPPLQFGQGTIEILIKAGAFDGMGARRSQLLAVLPRAVQAAQSRQEDRRRGQRSFFDAMPADDGRGIPAASSLPDLPELPEATRLAEEKKALGFYMSSHPLTRHEALIACLGSHRVADLADLADKAEVTLGGMISGVKLRNVQKSRSEHTRMAKFTFEDLGGATAAMLWPEEYARHAELVVEDRICFIQGSLSRQRDPAEVVVKRVIPIERAAAELAKGVILRLRRGRHDERDVERLHGLLRSRVGNLDLWFEVLGIGEGQRALLKAAPNYRVAFDAALVEHLATALGPESVRVFGPSHRTAPVFN